MLQLQRQNEIIQLLETHKELTVKELAALLHASEATVRRDLAQLERGDRIRRSFGGAVRNDLFVEQLPLAIRATAHTAEKKRICAKAAAQIAPGDTIFVDGSTTTFFLAQFLQHIPELTVVTNNPYLTIRLSELKVRCSCTGGDMSTGSLSLVGHDAERFVATLRADKFFFSARGYSEEGEIYDTSKQERDLKHVMLEHSSKHYLLCDRSKRGTRYPYIVTDLSHIEMLIDET